MKAAVWKPVPKATGSLSDIQTEQLVAHLSGADITVPAAPAAPAVADVDADLAMAVALQQQYDRERFELESRLATAHAKAPVGMKVRLDSDVLVTSGERVHTDAFSDDSWESGEDEDEDAEDGEEKTRNERKPHGRVARTDYYAPATATTSDWKTKHDPALTGERNTSYILEHHPEAELGDLQGDMDGGEAVKLNNPVFNSMMRHAERDQTRRVRKTFGSETETRDQVIDQKTRLMLQKLINADVLTTLNGAISTGKESVVFHATHNEREYAVKIFKTTLNEFKNRQRYVEGEHRFRSQHKRQNPRRLIRLWAEKELRNLKRCQNAGIRCPEALLLKKHVLVLAFVGKDGTAAPKLRDAGLTGDKLRAAYEQCVAVMHTLYHGCRLVHCDLSEYNLLWYKGELWLIDLAQGVDVDHPNAIPFLQRDCKRVSDFFRQAGLVGALSTRQLFDYVTTAKCGDLEAQVAACEEAALADPDAADAVWYASFIPRSLGDLADPEGAQDRDVRDRFHEGLLRADGTGGGGADDVDEDGASSSETDSGGEGSAPLHKDKTAPVSKEARKLAKKAAKQVQRERRAQRSEKNM